MQRCFRTPRDRKHDPPRRRYAVVGAALTLLILFSATACGAAFPDGTTTPLVRLSGVVLDDRSGSAVPSATVSLQPAGFVTVTAADGTFAFRLVPEGRYEIVVRSVGFEPPPPTGVQVSLDHPVQVEIRLTPTVYDLGRVSVEDVRRPLSSARPLVIDKEAIRTSRAGSLADVLQKVDGLYVQETGGAGPVEIRMRGSSSKQVLVLIDGQRLNASGTGVADLSGIPLELVERIEVHTGGASAEFGPDALAGAVNIVTRPESYERDRLVNLYSSVGAYHAFEGGFDLNNPILLNGVSNRFNYSHREADGDFEYAYAVGGSAGQPVTYEGARQNNEVRTENYFGSGMAQLARPLSLSYSVHHHRTRRGLPGSVSRPDTTGRARDDRLIGTAALTYAAMPLHQHELSFGFTQFDQSFRNLDPGISPAYHYDSRFLNDQVSIKQSSQAQIWRGNQVRGLLEYRRDRLFHDDYLRPRFAMGLSVRTSRGAALMVSQRFDVARGVPVDRIALDAAMRYDYAQTEADYVTLLDRGESHVSESWSPRIGAAISYGRRYHYTLRAGYGKSLRLPSINALFWRGDARSTGNPDLRPEHAEHSDISLEIAGDLVGAVVDAIVTYFHSIVTYWVVWLVNFQDQWQPMNLGRARITGHEESFAVSALGKRIRLEWHNAVTDAINKVPDHATYNKRLVFYPRYLSRLSVEGRLGVVSARYSIRWADKTYTNDANTKYYGAYRVDDLALGVEFSLGPHWTAGGTARIDNLRDRDYVLLANYPMPGRTIGADIRLTFTPGSRRTSAQAEHAADNRAH